MNDELTNQLKVFEMALWDSYLRVRQERNTYWVSLHKVMEYVGLPLPLFNERLQQLWTRQFSSDDDSKFQFGLEVDATPTEYHRLRNKHIIIDGCPMFIINMEKRK